MSTITKICPECRETFDYESARQGVREFCSTRCRLKKWQREKRAKDPETVRAYGRKYYLKYKAYRAEQQKLYRATHKKERSAQMKKYYAEHPEIRAQRAAYHAAHKDEHNARVRLQSQKARVKFPWRGLMNAAKSRARQKKIPFNLTKEWALARWTGKCEVTGLPFKLGLTGTGPQVWSPSIDRIKPSRGYTQENCRFVLVAVNIFKMTGTDDDMVEIAKAIAKFKPSKSARGNSGDL